MERRRRKGRLWVVSELYYPEVTSTGRFLTGIAEGLASDHDVRVLAAQPTYAARGIRAPATESRNDVEVRRVWSTRFPKDRLPLRAVNMITFTLSVLMQLLLRLRAGDSVLVVSNPPTLPFVVLTAAGMRRAEVILLVHDVYPEVLAACEVLDRSSWRYRLLQQAFRWLYRRANHVVAIGRDMRELLRLGMSVRPHQLHVIPNWGEVEHLRPAFPRRSALRTRVAADADFVVQYMGNMGRTHGVLVVLDAARAFGKDSRVHFLFVGWGAQRVSLERAVAEERMRHVSVVDPCPEEELPDYLRAADVAVIAMSSGMSGVSVPSRMYNVMAAGIPIVAVADDSSELAMVVRENAIGWVVPPGDSRRLADVITYARDHGDELKEMGARARQIAESRYARTHVIGMYRALLNHSTVRASLTDRVIEQDA